MKIAIVGESPCNPSGFGQQVRLLVEGFQKRNHAVECISAAWTDEKLDDVEEWRLPDLRDTAKIDEALSLIDPDVVICFWHTSGVQAFSALKYPPGNCLVFYWLPWEGTTLPTDSEDYFKRVESGRMVHLSNFAHELWLTHLSTDAVIPHGVDVSIFNRHPDPNPPLRRKLLVDKWRTKLNAVVDPGDLIILNVDRNIWHKRWDAVFDFVKKLQAKTDRKVRLIAHTIRVEKSKTPLEGYDLPALETTYGVAQGTIIYTDFDWMRGLSRTDIADLYRLADLRISMSEGEGFGIPTIEAAMCGCLQIVNNTTTMPELFPKNSPSLCEPAMLESKRGVLYQVPNINGMVERAYHLLFKSTDEKREKIIAANYQHAANNFASEKVIDAWLNLIQKNSTYNSDDRWYDLREGYETNFYNERDHHYMAQVLSKFGGNSTVLELGSFTGKFIESCISRGLFVRGIEPDRVAFEKCTKKAKVLSKCIPYLGDWPPADIIVATDFLTLQPRKQSERILKLAASRGKWIILRHSPMYKRGEVTRDLKWAEKFLESVGAGRRHDLEKIVCARWFKEFSHEIWQTQESWEDVLIPAGFE